MDVVARQHKELIPIRRNEERSSFSEATPCVVPACVGPGCTVNIMTHWHDIGAVDAHRAIGDGDLEHFDSAIAKEQFGRVVRVVTGEVKAVMVAIRLDAKWVGDADVATTCTASCCCRHCT